MIFRLPTTVYRILVALFFLLTFHFLLVTPTYAASEFLANYNLSYEVDNSGVTTVTEKVSLRNLTETQYASNFKLNISATQITEVAASDSQGPLEVTAKNEGKKTNISVNFNQQVAGKGKEYTFTLKFKSKDFAQNQGKVWQVTIPKISAPNSSDNYQLTLIVPVSFGDPTSILPEPVKQSEADNKLSLIFNKQQLVDTGVVANFGLNQLFKFDLSYILENNGLLPKNLEVTLPSSSNYQQVLLTSIEPKPQTTYFDGDGNIKASFKVNRGQKLTVRVGGLAKLSTSSAKKQVLSPKEQEIYTMAQKYWEKDTPQISGRLIEIFAGKNPQTNQDKARLIDKFVAATLSYDDGRLKNNDFQRLGALTVLNNPQKALCQEFADLFVALARSAGIPARQLIGYSYSNNSDLRPLSLNQGAILHAWAEYFDPNLGWMMVDPTWENTTGGVDYFSKFDLNHLVLVKRGVSSTDPTSPDDVKVEFSNLDFQPVSNVDLNLLSPDQIFAGLPTQVKVRIKNNGNVATNSAQLNLSSPDLDITGVTKSTFFTPQLPPGGFLEYTFDLKAKSPFESAEGVLKLNWADQTISKKILIKPFFTHLLFTPIIIGFVILVLILYLLTVFFHLKYQQKFKLFDKKR